MYYRLVRKKSEKYYDLIDWKLRFFISKAGWKKKFLFIKLRSKKKAYKKMNIGQKNLQNKKGNAELVGI